MSAQGIAIAVLLISFLVMILLRFPIAYAVALSSLLCLLTGIAAYHDLSADGKRNQFFQSDGSAVLYHDGCTDGHRWYLRKTDCTCQCLRRMDDRWYGNGKYRSILFFRWNFRFCIC